MLCMVDTTACPAVSVYVSRDGRNGCLGFPLPIRRPVAHYCCTLLHTLHLRTHARQSKEEAFLVKKIQENACFVISKSYW